MCELRGVIDESLAGLDASVDAILDVAAHLRCLHNASAQVSRISSEDCLTSSDVTVASQAARRVVNDLTHYHTLFLGSREHLAPTPTLRS